MARKLILNFQTFLFTDHVGELNITDAYLVGLSMLERSGDCTLTYDFQMLQLTVNFVIKELMVKFNNLTFNLNVNLFQMDGAYSLHVLGMNPAGNILCHLEEQIVSVSLLIDVKESTVNLQHFETTNEKYL